MYSHISAFCFPEYFSILVLSILSPLTCPPPPPPKQVFRVSGQSQLDNILQTLDVRLICSHCCIVITVPTLYYGRDRVNPHYKLRIKIAMVTRGYGGERIFLRKSGQTIEECWRSSVSDGRGVAAIKACWVRDMQSCWSSMTSCGTQKAAVISTKS